MFGVGFLYFYCADVATLRSRFFIAVEHFEKPFVVKACVLTSFLYFFLFFCLETKERKIQG